MASLEIEQIVDVDRYPVNRPGDPRYLELMAAGRQALDELALFCYDSKPGTTFDQWYINELSQGLP